MLLQHLHHFTHSVRVIQWRKVLHIRNIFRKGVAFLNSFTHSIAVRRIDSPHLNAVTRNIVARLAHEEYIPQERCFS